MFFVSPAVSRSFKRLVPGWFLVCLSLSNPAFADYQSPAFDQGRERMGHKDWDGAIVSFGEAIGLSSENPRAYLLRGQCFYNLKNYSQALDDFSHAIQASPDKSEFYLWRGNTYANLNQDENAIADYQKAIKEDPKLAVQYFAVPPEKRVASSQPSMTFVGHKRLHGMSDVEAADGTTEVKKKTTSRAVDLYKAAMDKSFPTGLPADFSTAVIASALAPIPLGEPTKPATITTPNISIEETTGNDKKKAVKAAKRKDDDFDQITHNKFKHDLDQYSEAIRSDSGNSNNYFHRGRAHQYLKEYAQSLQDFSDAIRLSPQNSQFYLARASIYMLMKKPLLAKADVKSAQSVDPTVPAKVVLDLEPPQP